MRESKLIAEFMGIHLHGPKGNQCIINGAEMNVSDIPYKTSWDSLIPVLDKVWETQTNFDNEEWALTLMDATNPPMHMLGIYLTIVDFIKEYNENK